MVDWSDIEIRIPTVPERRELVTTLNNALYQQTGYTPALYLATDERPSNERVRQVFGRRPSTDWMLFMEDDVRLATTFGERIPDVLKESTRVAVQFCDFRNGEHGLSTADKPILSMQCVAVRSEVLEGFVEFYYDWIDSVNHEDAVDIAFGEYCTSLGEPIDVYRPSQVQHRPVPSTFNNRSKYRQSPTFEEQI